MDDDYAGYATALTFNQTLWTILQADLSGDGDDLPENFRDDLLALSLARGLGFQGTVSSPGASRTH